MARVTADDATVAVRRVAGAPGPVEAAVYDPSAGVWIATGAAPLSPRIDPIMVWDDGRLLVWGGEHAQAHIRPDPPSSPEEALGPGDQRRPVPGGAVWTPAGGWAAMAEAPLAPRVQVGWTALDGRLVVWGTPTRATTCRADACSPTVRSTTSGLTAGRCCRRSTSPRDPSRSSSPSTAASCSPAAPGTSP